jgi:hypothetical protein
MSQNTALQVAIVHHLQDRGPTAVPLIEAAMGDGPAAVSHALWGLRDAEIVTVEEGAYTLVAGVRSVLRLLEA